MPWGICFVTMTRLYVHMWFMITALNKAPASAANAIAGPVVPAAVEVASVADKLALQPIILFQCPSRALP